MNNIKKEMSPELKFLQSLTTRGIRLGLERTREFSSLLNNPQNNYPLIHVAGTNGKGSTCRMIYSILRESGYKVGLFTSPHLVRFNERIIVNEEMISDAEVENFIIRHRDLIDRIGASFFEVTTVMALEHFKNKNVDYVVLEVGLGGTYDSTNIVKPEISVITSIGKDHENVLGNTLLRIAGEKAGIIKTGTPCVIARQRPKIMEYIKQECHRKQAPFYYSPDVCKITSYKQSLDGQEVKIKFLDFTIDQIKLPSPGKHQASNLQTALTAIKILDISGIKKQHIERGIERLKLPGRCQVLHKDPLVIYDAGHNLHGIRAIVKTVRMILPTKKIDILIALKDNKNFNTLGKILRPLMGKVFITEIPTQDSVRSFDIYQQLRKHLPEERLLHNPDIGKILKRTRQNRDNPLLIIGSHYIANNVYVYFKNLFDKYHFIS